MHWQANPDEETTDWRAVCGKTASTVRRAGTAKAVSDPYQTLSGTNLGSPVEDRPFFHGAGTTPKVERVGDQTPLRFDLVNLDYPPR